MPRDSSDPSRPVFRERKGGRCEALGLVFGDRCLNEAEPPFDGARLCRRCRDRAQGATVLLYDGRTFVA